MPLTLGPVAEYSEWLQVLAILIGALILAKGIRTLISIWLGRSDRLSETDIDRVILEELDYPLYLTLVLGAVYITLPTFAPERLGFIVGGAILTVVLLAWTRAGIRTGSRIVKALGEAGYELEFAPVMKNLWTFFLLFGAFFLLLSIWNIDITPLLASAGVLGIVIGIAARDSIGNLLGGLSLHLDKTFELGDMIQLDDGTRGTVTDLSIRSTTILTLDHIAITIPNAELNRTRVVNESAPVRRRRLRLDVGVGYESNLDQVEEVLIREAEEERIILDSPEPIVRFRSFDDSAIRAQLMCYIEHPALLARAEHVLVKRVTAAFRREGIKIPFPQQELMFYESGNRVRVLNEEADEEGLGSPTGVD